MKRLLLMLMALLCVSSAFALQVSDAVIEDEPGRSSATFTITNNENYRVKNLNIETNADAKYDVDFEYSATSVAKDGVLTVTVRADVPADASTSLTTIGTITVTGELDVPASQAPQSWIFPDFNSFPEPDEFERIAEPATPPDFPEINLTDATDTCIQLQSALDELMSVFEHNWESVGSIHDYQLFAQWRMNEFDPLYAYYIAQLAENNCTLVDDGGDDDPINTTVTATSSLKMARVKHLVIEKVKIDCGDLERVYDGDTVEDIKPGITCDVFIDVKNTYTDDDDIYFDDVLVEFNGDRYADDASKTISLDPEEQQTVHLTVDIDFDGEGDEDVSVRVSGEDSEGKDHEDEWDFTLVIERPSHNVEIQKISLVPSDVDLCVDNSVEIVVRIENTGTKDEDEAAVEVRVPSLGFSKTVDDISLDEGDDETVSVNVPVPSSSSGTYTVEVRTYYDNVAASDYDVAQLVVSKCSAGIDDVVITPPKLPKDKVIVVPPSDGLTDEVIVAEPVEEGFTSSPVYTILLVMANLGVLGLLGVLGVTIARNLKTKKF